MCGNRLARMLLVAAAASLILGIGRAGLWEPHEVSVAELSRRIALNLLGGHDLAVAGADNSLPIRSDLARGELPFTSAALGFRIFGLSAWAGRLPLALWAASGLFALYAGVARLRNRRTALYAVLVLASTPLYFLQARTLLGDAVTLSAFCMAWSGLSVATLVPRLSRGVRLSYALLGVFGLYAGFWCRGALPAVAAPALSVALAALMVGPVAGVLARWLSRGLLALGLAALWVGIGKLTSVQASGEYSVFVGSAVASTGELPTFDALLAQLGHAAFPWSATAPLALAVVAGQSSGSATAERLAPLASAALGLSLSLAVGAWLAPTVGVTVLPGLCCFAVLIAFALREIEQGKLGSPLLGLSVAALAVILGSDLRSIPEKSLSAFALTSVTWPEGMREPAALYWLAVGVGFALVVVLALYERNTDGQTIFQRAEYERVVLQLQRVWDGNLVFALLVLEAALVGFLALSALSERVVHLPQLETFGSSSRKLAAGAAIAVPLAALMPLGAMLLRDLARVVFSGVLVRGSRWLTPTRAQGVLLVGAGVGFSASFGFYPAVAQQISTKQVFERYRELRQGDEPLGLLGEANESVRYQAGPRVQHLADVSAAFDWLGQGKQRRWLVFGKDDLAELNARHRERARRNLFILDARSSEVRLASTQLRPTEQDENPLAGVVLDSEPPLQYRLDVSLGDKLDVLGWSVLSLAGEPQESVVPGTRYRFLICYRVTAPISGSWQTFVHVDGFQRRFNVDHPLLEGKYPMSLWRERDLIADVSEFTLEPNFTPGRYRVYFGLYSGSRRLEVTRGNHEENRISAGALEVR